MTRIADLIRAALEDAADERRDGVPEKADLLDALAAAPVVDVAKLAEVIREHRMIHHHGGDGVIELREAWVTYACGAHLWEWQQFYHDREDEPESMYAEHIAHVCAEALRGER